MIAGKWEQLNAHPRTRDAVVASVWLLIGLAALQLAGIRLWADFALFHTDGTVYLLALIAIAAVALMRSTRPFLALGLGASIAAIDLAFGGSLGVVLVLSDLVYAAVKYGSDRGLRIALWLALVTAGLLAVGLLVVSPHSSTVPIVAVQFALIIFVSAAWGWAVRIERSRTRAILVQAHAQQTSEMRERIAHDLHDLVANHIAVAGLHIEAAKLRLERETAAPDPDHSAGQGASRPSRSTGSIAASSSATMASLDRAKQGTDAAHRELRALIEVLTATIDLENAGLDALEHAGASEAGAQGRGNGPESSIDSATTAGSGTVSASIFSADIDAPRALQEVGAREGQRAAGPSQTEAEIAGALDGLSSLLPDGRALEWSSGALVRTQSQIAAEPPATQTAVLRVLRELIANAAKHGSGAVVISTEAAPTATRITVANQVSAGGAAAQGSKLGLRSSEMILKMVGGQLESGLAGAGEHESATNWAASISLPGNASRAA